MFTRKYWISQSVFIFDFFKQEQTLMFICMTAMLSVTNRNVSFWMLQDMDELINALKVLLTNHELYTLPLKIYEFIK